MKLLLSLFWLAVVAVQPHAAEPALHAHLPREVVINEVEFVLVPAGSFWHTVENADVHAYVPARKDAPYRDVKVWIDAFYIGKYEARLRHFVRFLNAKVIELPQERDIPGQDHTAEQELQQCAVIPATEGAYAPRDSHPDAPAVNVSWHFAAAFARWMGFRLPTEAEWTKAARGSVDKRLWPWGMTYPDDTYAAFYGRRLDCPIDPVNAYPKGQSPYGAYNMAGNVSEWVADWFNPTADDALRDGAHNPHTPDKPVTTESTQRPYKISKGGRWAGGAEAIAIPHRLLTHPDAFSRGNGVRFALDVATVKDHLAAGTARVVLP